MKKILILACAVFVSFMLVSCLATDDVILLYSSSYHEELDIKEIIYNYDEYLSANYNMDLNEEFFEENFLYTYHFMNNRLGENIYLLSLYEIKDNKLIIQLKENEGTTLFTGFGPYTLIFSINKTYYQKVDEVIIKGISRHDIVLPSNDVYLLTSSYRLNPQLYKTIVDNYDEYLEYNYDLNLSEEFFDEYLLYTYRFMNNYLGDDLYYLASYGIFNNVLRLIVKSTDKPADAAIGPHILVFAVLKDYYNLADDIFIKGDVDSEDPKIPGYVNKNNVNLLASAHSIGGYQEVISSYDDYLQSNYQLNLNRDFFVDNILYSYIFTNSSLGSGLYSLSNFKIIEGVLKITVMPTNVMSSPAFSGHILVFSIDKEYFKQVNSVEIIGVYPKSYNIKAIDHNGFMANKIEGKYLPGQELTIQTNILLDVDLHMYVNGEFHSKQTPRDTKKGYIWEFYLIMPNNDVIITFKVDSSKMGLERKFFSVKEVYENGYITKGELELLASFNQQTILSKDIENYIKKDWADGLKYYRQIYASIDEVEISGYFGFYGGYYFLIMTDHYTNYPEVITEEEIDGVLFRYGDTNKILAWRP